MTFYTHPVKKIAKLFLVLGFSALIFDFLLRQNLIIPLIAFFSLGYLIIYSFIGTVLIFSSALDFNGKTNLQNAYNGPLYSIIVYALTVFLFWIFLLMFWPIFLIPDRDLRRNKYPSIEKFEKHLRQKYRKQQAEIYEVQEEQYA